MAKVITICNQKGGVGKSTIAAALGAGLTLKGFRVLYVDTDAQGDLTDTLGANATGINTLSALDVLQNPALAAEAIQTASGVHVIASSPALIGLDGLLLSVSGKEYRLKEALAKIDSSYDIIIIDTPPALGIATINALTASKYVIIPAEAAIKSLRGLARLYNTLQAVRENCNPGIEVLGIVLNMYNPRTVIHRDMDALLCESAKLMQSKVYNTRIRRYTALEESEASHTDIYSYSPKSKASDDFRAFVDEVEQDIRKESL